MQTTTTGRPAYMPKLNVATCLPQPAIFSIRGLYRPELVTILVGEPAIEYHPEFKEGQTKCITLPDVVQFIFEVFLAWLWTGRIFYEESGFEADKVGPTEGEAGGMIEGNKRKREIDEESDGEDGGGHDKKRKLGAEGCMVADLEDCAPEVADNGESFAGDEGHEQSQQSPGEESPASTSTPPLSPAGRNQGQHVIESQEQRENAFSADPYAAADEHQSKQAIPEHEYDNSDPVTWHWDELFELYVFADKYDSRGFRNSLIEVIQIKALKEEPRNYFQPDEEAYRYVFTHIPASSPLYRLMIDMMVYHLDPSDGPSDFDILPSDVLAIVWLKTMQVAAFYRCSECNGKNLPHWVDCKCAFDKPCDSCKGWRCGNREHRDITTDRGPWEVEMCRYHEHETSEEMELCKQRWTLIHQERAILGPRRGGR